jgi:effector-binding domain-containing protein
MSRPQDQIPIGMFSMVTRLTPRALRLYDDKGILKPERKEQFTGYRYYSYSQIDRAIMIRNLARFGFGLQEMGSILNWMDSNRAREVEDIFKERVKEIEREIDKLEGIRAMLLERSMREVVKMNDFNPEIKNIPSIRVLSRRETGSYQSTIPKLIPLVFAEVQKEVNVKARVSIIGPIMFICHDKEYKEDNADIEVALPITGNITISDDFEVRKLAPVKAATLFHKGPYEEVGSAYRKLISYIYENGFEMTGPSRELYLNDPGMVTEEELLTEIQLPIG